MNIKRKHNFTFLDIYNFLINNITLDGFSNLFFTSFLASTGISQNMMENAAKMTQECIFMVIV